MKKQVSEYAKAESITFVHNDDETVDVVYMNTKGENEILTVGNFCPGLQDIQKGLTRIRVASEALRIAKLPKLKHPLY